MCLFISTGEGEMGVGVSLVVQYFPRGYFRSLPSAIEVMRGIQGDSLTRFAFGVIFESDAGWDCSFVF